MNTQTRNIKLPLIALAALAALATAAFGIQPTQDADLDKAGAPWTPA